MGRAKSKRPRWSAERRVSRSQGARGRLASVLRRVSHTRQGAAIRTERLFGAPPPSLRAQRAEGDKERGAGPCASAVKRPNGQAKRWLRRRSVGCRTDEHGFANHEEFARRGWGGAEEGIGRVAW